jgi:hypothetical protein
MEMAGNMLIVRRPGLPPWLSMMQAAALPGAGGLGQGGPADASAGLQKVDGTWNGEQRTWAWNPVSSEWQLLHVVREGDTLWAMGRTYYGESSVANVHRICHLEQNAPIIGASSDCARGVPGDILLIPGLPQPGGETPGNPPGGAVPPPGGFEPPTTPTDPIGNQRPPGYPDDWPWPPGWSTSPVETPGETPPAETGDGAEPTPVDAPIQTTQPTRWWTPGKIALVGGLGATTLGLIIWGVAASKKPKRRRSRRRR